jgi:hypothetical protein
MLRHCKSKQFILVILTLTCDFDGKVTINSLFHSQFSDIYQEEHFINYLTPDIRIVKELPKELQSLDLEAIGSVVSFLSIIILSALTPELFLFCIICC